MFHLRWNVQPNLPNLCHNVLWLNGKRWAIMMSYGAALHLFPFYWLERAFPILSHLVFSACVWTFFSKNSSHFFVANLVCFAFLFQVIQSQQFRKCNWFAFLLNWSIFVDELIAFKAHKLSGFNTGLQLFVSHNCVRMCMHGCVSISCIAAAQAATKQYTVEYTTK